MFLRSAFEGQNQWWLYLSTLVLVVIGILLGQLPLLGIIGYYASQNELSSDVTAEMMANLDFEGVGLDQNVALLFMLFPFVAGLATLWLCVKFLHKKDFNRLINPINRINWNKVFFAFGLWTAITVVAELIFWGLNPDSYFTDFNFSKFVFLLLIALLVLPLQTSFEEIFFRGYILQGISLISKYRWIPLLITSVAFGALHFMNPEVAAFGTGVTMAYYIGTGLFLGFLTLMDDGLELALGIHAATNIFSATFVTFDESALQTAAIFHTTDINMVSMLIALLIAAVIFTWIVSRRYGWTDWTKWYAKNEKPGNLENLEA